MHFSGLTFAGALPWCAALPAAGYVLGANYYERVSGAIGQAAVVGLLLVVAP